MDWLLQPEAWIALITLTSLEIVLGIDNIIFISILVGRLPPELRQKGRIIGLSLAMLTRIALLITLALIMRLKTPLFNLFSLSISGRDLILIFGGLFLLVKSTKEIHNSLEELSNPESKTSSDKKHKKSFFIAILLQIAIIDIVFSLDSVITAVGLVTHIPVMVIAIVLSVIIMMFASKPIGDFVDLHPSIKMLALSFLILIGVTLISDGFSVHFPKGYIYFAMAFSVAVESLNIHYRNKRLKIPPNEPKYIKLNKPLP